jgi:hypothetical protein
VFTKEYGIETSTRLDHTSAHVKLAVVGWWVGIKVGNCDRVGNVVGRADRVGDGVTVGCEEGIELGTIVGSGSVTT